MSRFGKLWCKFLLLSLCYSCSLVQRLSWVFLSWAQQIDIQSVIYSVSNLSPGWMLLTHDTALWHSQYVILPKYSVINCQGGRGTRDIGSSEMWYAISSLKVDWDIWAGNYNWSTFCVKCQLELWNTLSPRWAIFSEIGIRISMKYVWPISE